MLTEKVAGTRCRCLQIQWMLSSIDWDVYFSECVGSRQILHPEPGPGLKPEPDEAYDPGLPVSGWYQDRIYRLRLKVGIIQSKMQPPAFLASDRALDD